MICEIVLYKYVFVVTIWIHMIVHSQSIYAKDNYKRKYLGIKQKIIKQNIINEYYNNKKQITK